MSAAGRYSLGVVDVTTPGTIVTSWADGLSGVQSLSAQFNFNRTSGGTTCTVYLQTSLDGGVTAIDLACIAFTTTSVIDVVNLRSDASVVSFAPTDGSLGAGTVKDGVMGDRIRAKVVVVGNYGAASSLAIDVVTR